MTEPVLPNSTVVVDHPLVARHLAVLRDRETPSHVFRQTLADISMLLVYESLRDLRTEQRILETPLEPTVGDVLQDEIVVISILRAGLGMVDSVLRLIPEARIGHLGIYRDEEILQPVGYYESMPDWRAGAEVVVVDPMLATGGSAVHAINRVRAQADCTVRFVCVVGAPEGVAAVQRAHPGVPITCAGLDRELNAQGYICPGLGDAGDRLFRTE